MSKEWKYIIFISLISLICLILLLRSCKNDQVITKIEELREINKIEENEIDIISDKIDTIILPPEILIKTVKEEFIPQGFIDSLEQIITDNKKLRAEVRRLRSLRKTSTEVIRDTVIVYQALDVFSDPNYKITKSSNLFRDEYKVPLVDPVTSEIKITTLTRSKFGISGQLGYGMTYIDKSIRFGPYLGIGLHYEY